MTSAIGAQRLTRAAAGPDPSEEKDRAELREACRMFEAHFLSMLWKEMRKTVDKSGLIDGGNGEKIFTSMLDQAVSDATVKGGSMGIADMLERELSAQYTTRPKLDLKNGYQKQTRMLSNPVEGRISSGYGLREHPVDGVERVHAGVDIAAPAGTPVKAAASGVVEFAGEKGGYGNLVIIRHIDGASTRYGHLKDIRVKEGEKVTAGNKLGTVGSTGVSTGPHLHFELRNQAGAATDPLPRLAKSGGRLA